MKLGKVQIKNFRSIQYFEIEFDPNCRVLVGINESGKSNILKALSLLGKDSDPVKVDDLREALPDEDAIDESYVRFVFKFDKAETDKIFTEILGKILATTKNPDIVSYNGTKQSVKEFCDSRNESLYTVNIITENKSFTYWSLGDSYKMLEGWAKPSKACPADFNVETNGKQSLLSQYHLIKSADFKDIPPEYLEVAKLSDVASLSGGVIMELTKTSLPDTLFWEYDEGNLLPNSLKFIDFANNPNSCVPLKNMFTLAGIKDIKASIESKRQGTDNQFQNYLDGIAKKTTNHFRSVWKEYKTIEFSLHLHGDQIVPGIKEKNTHDFARRSDGFKRFVTFLLMISVNVKTDDLHDTLLLIDEPESGLHPSGARYLRDELIRIAKTNYVTYSTHSIFMIDSSEIGRHYIVKKKDEITTIEQAHASNIADEEVLYNALGHSVFSILKEKNILFEGWSDKHLFQIALEGSTAEIKKKFKEIGICHAQGVKSIRAITPLIELANRQCLILSDSDTPAKEYKKSYEREKGFGVWQNYQDADSTSDAVTAEDFIKIDFVTKQINATLTGKSMPVFAQASLPGTKMRVATIKKWLTDNGMNEDQASDTIRQIKNNIFENLKPQNIESTYEKILSGISV